MVTRSLTRLRYLPLCVMLCLAWYALAECATKRGAALVAWENAVLHGESWPADELSGTSRAVWPGIEQLLPWQAMQESVAWNDGLLARPRTLFFTVPASIAIHWLGITPLLAIRLTAQCAVLISLWLLFVTAASIGGIKHGYLALGVALTMPTVWHYGSYGVSVGGTLLATVLLYYAFWQWERRPTLGTTVTAIVVTVCATLQYAPLRVLMLPVLVITLGRIWRRWTYILLFLVVCSGVAWWQGSSGRWALYHARGEQMVTGSNFVEPTVWGNIQKRASELISLVTVAWTTPVSAARDLDPGVPLSPPVLTGMVGGVALAMSRRAFLDYHAITLLAGMAALMGALLLTSRVDLQRMAVLTVPIALFVAHGLAQRP